MSPQNSPKFPSPLLDLPVPGYPVYRLKHLCWDSLQLTDGIPALGSENPAKNGQNRQKAPTWAPTVGAMAPSVLEVDC